MRVEHVVEPGERRAGSQEVRPHRQDDRHPPPRRGRGVQQVGEESGTRLLEPGLRLLVLRPVGEHLLELVDHHEQPRLARRVAQGQPGEEVQPALIPLQILDQLPRLAHVRHGALRQERSRNLDGEVRQRIVPRPYDRGLPLLAPVDRTSVNSGDQTREHYRRLPAPRRPQHRQQTHALRCVDLPPQVTHQPVGQVLAPEEEPCVAGAERLQPAIRADPLIPGLDRLRPFLAGDPPDQPLEFLLVVERLEELDPRGVDEELEVRHVAPPRPLGPRQQDRDDVEVTVAYPLVDGDLQLLRLPRAQAAGTEEHHAGLAVAECLGERRLELPARGELPHLQIQRQPFPPQPPLQLLDGGPVLGALTFPECRANPGTDSR